METKFKVGDRVKAREVKEWDDYAEVGWEGKIISIDQEDVEEDSMPYEVLWDNGKQEHMNGYQLELIKGKRGRPAKAKPYKFALQYDLDEDPTEYFHTLPEVKARIRELAGNSSLKRDRIFIHEIKNTKKVELGVSLSIKKV